MKRLAPGLVVLGVAALICGIARPQEPLKVRAEKMRELMRSLPDGVYPLYVLGDLNEDGKVDGEDLRILTQLVDSLNKQGPPPQGVTCIAAGDLNRDGKIDAADVAMLKEWLAREPTISAPALYWNRQLPCTFAHLTIATMAQGHRAEEIPVILVGDGLTIANTIVTIHSGPATVTPASDGRGYAIKVASTAKPSDYIVLQLTTPDHRDYLFQMPIVEPSYQGEPPLPPGISR